MEIQIPSDRRAVPRLRAHWLMPNELVTSIAMVADTTHTGQAPNVGHSTCS